jgi:S-DNA-T family DNA segregation ATPase FtsK/SpoIIIE
VLGGQADDVIGTVVLLLAGLAALGIYADLTGPAGRVLDHGAADLIGWARALLPPALATVGVLLIRGRERREPARAAVGWVLGLIAAAGLGQLLDGPPHWKHLSSLRGAGGVVGWAAADPLRRGLAGGGAGLVLVVVALIAVLVITGTTVRTAADYVATAVAGTVSATVASARWLADQLRSDEREASLERHPATISPTVDTPARRRRPAAKRALDGLGEGLEAADAPIPAGQQPYGVPELDGVGDPLTPPSAALPARPAPEVRLPPPVPEGPPVQLELEVGRVASPGTWRLPPPALLKRAKAAEIDRKLVEALGATLEDALAAHGVETRLVGMTVGPTVTRYELELGPGVKVAKVTSLQKDIAYAMAAADVRILAPIPGRSAIGVEVPNRQRQVVTLGDILLSPEAQLADHPLEVAIGRDIAGRPILENLATMPHILIAGATGAGKSSCINSIITSILVRATPDQVRLILIDPKRVEMGQYNGLPHLLTSVVVNPKKAANALNWAVHEMERRYDLLAEVGVRDITGYNAAFDRGELVAELGTEREYERLPFICVVVDELNDLMMVAARDVEESICRIAQMARAVGIHLVIATQRPSVDVITGVIKANVPSRLAFAVSSLADSRVILDQPGAERLIGKGDMLLLTASSSIARRIQGAWVEEEEVRKVAAHWRRQSEPDYVPGVEGDDSPGGGHGGVEDDGSDDDLLEQALELVVRSQLGSTSMLQRKLRVGFARAGRIMDLLEQRGVVGPSEGSKARAVLMTIEELDERNGA